MASVMVFSFLRSKAREPRYASTDGRVIYAIGDVHGHLVLLDLLLDSIAADFSGAEAG